MDVYAILNYNLIDTSSDFMQTYNWIYQPFNCIEGIIWLIYIPKTIRKYWSCSSHFIVVLQCISFFLFGLSDFIEMSATSVSLLLFKGAILVALIQGHKALLNGGFAPVQKT